MKTIKCDRCGKEIPYVPPFMNCAIQEVISPNILMTVWYPINKQAKEVDLCDMCKQAVYSFIFDYHLPREVNE